MSKTRKPIPGHLHLLLLHPRLRPVLRRLEVGRAVAGGGQGGAEEVEAPVEGGQEEEQMRELADIMFPKERPKHFNVFSTNLLDFCTQNSENDCALRRYL